MKHSIVKRKESFGKNANMELETDASDSSFLFFFLLFSFNTIFFYNDYYYYYYYYMLLIMKKLRILHAYFNS